MLGQRIGRGGSATDRFPDIAERVLKAGMTSSLDQQVPDPQYRQARLNESQEFLIEDEKVTERETAKGP